MPDAAWILLMSLPFAALAIVMGVAIRYRKAYWLVAGYNTASSKEKQKYDIEGLGNHLGNGLITLGVLVVPMAIALAAESWTWASLISFLFFGTVLVILIGGQKFLPKNRRHGVRS